MSLIGVIPTSSGQAQSIQNAQVERQVAVLQRTAGYVAPGSINGSGVAGLPNHINVGSISTAEIKAGSITAESAIIANAAIDSAQIKDLAVITAKIQLLNVDTAQIANLAVTTGKIGDLQVDTAKITNLAVTTAKIGLLQVDTGQIANLAVTNAKIADASIENAKIANLDAGKITTGYLHADRLEASSAFADQLLARLIHTGSLVATTGLSAVSAKLGSLVIDTAAGLPGSLRIGPAAAGHLYADSTGISGFAADGTTVTFKLDTSTGKVITLVGLGGDNMFLNASGERVDSVSPWVCVGPGTLTTVASSTAQHGARILQIAGVTTGSFLSHSPQIACIPGKNYVLSGYVKCPAAGRVRYAIINWYASDGTTLIRQDAATAETTASVGTGWERAVISKKTGGVPIDCPAGAAYAQCYFFVVASGTETFYFDALQFEEGTVVTGFAPKADEILPNQVTATELASNSVSGNKAGVAEPHIIPGTIIATDLFVTTLSAITADMGTLTAGRIQGGTIDGNVLDVGSVRADKLTVGASQMLRNGGFEDIAYGQTYQFPANWTKGVAFGTGGTGDMRRLDTAVDPGWTPNYVRSGAGALWMFPQQGVSGDYMSDKIPVTAGEVISLTMWMSAVGGAIASNIYVGFYGGAITGTEGHGGWLLDSGAIAQGWNLYKFSFTVPAGWNWARLDILNYLAVSAVAGLAIDDVSVRRASGNTDIRPGALDTHTITLTGANGMIRTAASGQRLEMTSTDLVKWDSGGYKAVKLGTTDGLDLLSSTTATPPNDRKIRWVEQASPFGTKMSMQVYVTTKTQAELRAISAGAAGCSMDLVSQTGDNYAQLTCDAYPALSGGQYASVTAYAAGTSGPAAAGFSIIESSNASDFVTKYEPKVKVYRSTTQSMTTGVETVITFSTTIWDAWGTGEGSVTDTHWDTATALYCRREGRYEVTGQIGYTSNAGGSRGAWIKHNGNYLAYQVNGPGNASPRLQVTAEVYLYAGDYVQLFGFQNSGVTLTTLAGSSETWFQMRRIGY